jgi:hypothetical protein
MASHVMLMHGRRKLRRLLRMLVWPAVSERPEPAFGM